MRGHRPKLSTLFSNRTVPTITTPEPPHLTSTVGGEWLLNDPPPSGLDPNVERMAQSLLSTLLESPHTALPPELNHFVLYIIEAYQKEVANRHTLEIMLTKQVEETTSLRKKLSEIRAEREELEQELTECQHEMQRLTTELEEKDHQISNVLRESIPVLSHIDAEILRKDVGNVNPQDTLTRRLSEAIVATPKAGTLRSVSNQPNRETELSRLFKTFSQPDDTTDFRPGLPVDKAPIDTTLPTSFAPTEAGAVRQPNLARSQNLLEDVSSSFSSTGGDLLDDEFYNGSNISDMVADKESRMVLGRLTYEMAQRRNISKTDAIKCLGDVVLAWGYKGFPEPTSGPHTPLLAIPSQPTTSRRTSYTPGDDSTFQKRARSIRRDDTTDTTSTSPTQLDFRRNPFSPSRGNRTSTLSSLLDPSPGPSDSTSFTRAKENERSDRPDMTRSTSSDIRSGFLSPSGSASSTVRKSSTPSRIPQLQSPMTTSPIRRPAGRRNRQSSNSSMATVVRRSPAPMLQTAITLEMDEATNVENDVNTSADAGVEKEAKEQDERKDSGAQEKE